MPPKLITELIFHPEHAILRLKTRYIHHTPHPRSQTKSARVWRASARTPASRRHRSVLEKVPVSPVEVGSVREHVGYIRQCRPSCRRSIQGDEQLRSLSPRHRRSMRTLPPEEFRMITLYSLQCSNASLSQRPYLVAGFSYLPFGQHRRDCMVSTHRSTCPVAAFVLAFMLPRPGHCCFCSVVAIVSQAVGPLTTQS